MSSAPSLELISIELNVRTARVCCGVHYSSLPWVRYWYGREQGFVFFFVAALWAYYHLVKQHYGFMVLYKKKNGDLARVDNALDRLLLLFAFNYPFVEFIARDPEAMARVPAVLRGGVSGFSKLLLIGTVRWVSFG
jgi:hypothetical protein